MNTPAYQVQLCFGQVRHHRLRPAANIFQYGVYYMRLPLRAMEQDEFTPLFCSHNRFNLLSFHDADHGDGQRPLLAWIDGLLKKEGILDANGEVWLQTFPRVLGYVFNPVSFWFCHRKDGALRAVLCEVSNTFGERHCYLLDTDGRTGYGQELTAKKVFHVSPFCKVEGRYRFRFMRATRTVGDRQSESTVARIDYDDAEGPLLLTSISGNAETLSDGAIAKAFFRYPLMTFGVVAKIHWQALRLWLKRIPFFSKPAMPQQEVTR
jgi:DUF1365 family protein